MRFIHPCAVAVDRCWRVLAALLFFIICSSSQGETRVEDIFGRSLLDRGLELIDWDGRLANPLIKVYVRPPTNAVLPGVVTLQASQARLYFDLPSSVSINGPSKSLVLPLVSSQAPVGISIFPDRDGWDETATLTLVFRDAAFTRQTNHLAIRVRDLDRARPNQFTVHLDYERDTTGFFTDEMTRAITRQAADDWSYFFDDMKLDWVPAGVEPTLIWSNDYRGHYTLSNSTGYQGYLLYAYGTSNAAHRSGGEGSWNGGVQQSGKRALSMKRSGGFSAEVNGNYNQLGWLRLTNDADWLITGNLRHETNDFCSVAHHEIGHALIFNRAHPGLDAAYHQGGIRSSALSNYYGRAVPIDPSQHLNNVVDPESGRGAFGNEYYGNVPRRRWIITKLDLLCAEAVGYRLRPNSAFAPLRFASPKLPEGKIDRPYSYACQASGGLPIYFWEISAGNLPPGLNLDSFSGTISGRPVQKGMFQFRVRVRDYHEGSAGVEQLCKLVVRP